MMPVFDIFYMKPEFFRDGSMGVDWLRERNQLPFPFDRAIDPLKEPRALENTHVWLTTREFPSLEATYMGMQGEVWSPNGEARSLIRSKGLEHTSMSVGDVVRNHDTGKSYMVDRFGFVELE